MPRRDFEERRAARVERLEARAAKAQREADAAHKQSKEMMEAIPFGQPILVGHHSEGRDRRYRDRAWNLLGKAVKGWEKADHYNDRAAAAQSNTAISSDDPEALEKLDARIAELEQKREDWKTTNAAYRKAHTAELRAMTVYGRSQAVPYPSYALQNLGGNIARLKERRAQLAKVETRIDAGEDWREHSIGDVRIVEDLDDNRTRIHFPGKPDDATRAALKSAGFRWSPTAGAWQRQCSNAAWWQALQVVTRAGYGVCPDGPACDDGACAQLREMQSRS